MDGDPKAPGGYAWCLGHTVSATRAWELHGMMGGRGLRHPHHLASGLMGSGIGH